MFQTEEATLPAGTLRYHTVGSGAPVLYLHAAGGLTPSRPLDALAQGHRVLAPVAPGFDGTAAIDGVATVRDYAALVAGFAEAELGGRFDVIGSSFGSWVALWLAVLRPDLVAHLILQVPAGFRFGGKGGLPADPDARMRALYAHPDRIVAEPKAPELVEGNGRAYAAFAGDITVDEELSARLGEIEAVTLILLGTEDPVVTPEGAAHLKRSIPISQRVFVYDAAHSIEVDQPERVTRLWLTFLERGQGFVLPRRNDAA